jgi:hypothetical protein
MKDCNILKNKAKALSILRRALQDLEDLQVLGGVARLQLSTARRQVKYVHNDFLCGGYDNKFPTSPDKE